VQTEIPEELDQGGNPSWLFLSRHSLKGGGGCYESKKGTPCIYPLKGHFKKEHDVYYKSRSELKEGCKVFRRYFSHSKEN
jgi:hypothetical protein